MAIRNVNDGSAVHLKEKRMCRRSVFGLLAALLLIGCLGVNSAAAADKKDKNGELSNQRSVQGAVTDSNDNPVSGAVVYIKNNKTLQIRSFITKDGGTYYFHSLS